MNGFKIGGSDLLWKLAGILVLTGAFAVVGAIIYGVYLLFKHVVIV
jgi:hypothetical protein